MKILSFALPLLAVSSCLAVDISGRLGKKKHASASFSRPQGKDIWRPDPRRHGGRQHTGRPTVSGTSGHSDMATRKLKEWRNRSRRVSGEAQTLPPLDSSDEVDMEKESGNLDGNNESLDIKEDSMEEEEEEEEGGGGGGEEEEYTAPTESKQPPWGFELGDIAPDPSVKYGELENGIRYAIMPNSSPPGQMEIRFRVNAGAFYESDEEDGISHYIEHMAFRSTKNYPNDNLVEDFERIGVGYGADLNAYTTYEETVYKQSLPKTDNTTTSIVFQWLRDVVDGVLFIEEEIEKERGVIMSEMQSSESGFNQVYFAHWQWQTPDHIIAKRDVIGTEETIESMTRDMFVQYYKKWYNTRRAAIVIVGDMSTEDMEQLVVDTFESVEDLGERGEDPDRGPVPEGYGLKTQVFLNRELTDTSILIETIKPRGFVPDTESNRALSLQFDVINDMIWQRIQDLTRRGGNSTAIRDGYAWKYSQFGMDMGGILVWPKEGQWIEAVAELEQLWRGIITYGFTQSEFDETKLNLQNSYEQSVLTQDSTLSEYLVNDLAYSVSERSVFSSPEEDLRVASNALDGMTPESLHELYRSFWDTEDIFLYMDIPSLDGTAEDAVAELEEAFLSSQDVEVEPPVEGEAVVFAYTDFGTPGTIVEDTFIGDVEVRQMVLSNNVRVNMKQTDFESDIINFDCSFGLGRLSQPKIAGLDEFLDFVVYYSGLGQHDLAQLESATAGTSLFVTLTVGDYDFKTGGYSSRKDLELALQLLAAFFVDPAFRDSAVERYRDEIPSKMNALKTDLYTVFSKDVTGWLLGNDERFVAPTAEGLLALEASDASDWLMPFLNNSYMECSFVGDFNEDATVDFILATLGAIPERENSPPEIPDELRAIDMPSAPATKSFPYESKLPKAAAFVTWEIPSDLSYFFIDERSEDTYRSFSLLRDIFSERMRVQLEYELGGAYSPYAVRRQDEAFDYGLFVAISEGLPEEVEVFTDIILSIAANISAGDISQDEFDRARITILSNVEDGQRDNMYWLRSIGESQAKPFKLDWPASSLEFYENAILDDIKNLAMEYLSPDNAYQLSVVPANSTDG